MNETVWACEGVGKKVAVTDWAAFIVTTQLPVPLHPAPLQLPNTDPLAGTAVKVTCVPLANAALHMAPQSIPAGLLATVPLPLPAFVTVRVYNCVKLAFTTCAPRTRCPAGPSRPSPPPHQAPRCTSPRIHPPRPSWPPPPSPSPPSPRSGCTSA